jgi:hypothetical protein
VPYATYCFLYSSAIYYTRNPKTSVRPSIYKRDTTSITALIKAKKRKLKQDVNNIVFKGASKDSTPYKKV